MLRMLLLCLLSVGAALSAEAAAFAERNGPSGMLVSTDWLARNIGDPKVVVLHVAREQSHYDAGHVAGARFLRLSDIAVTRASANDLAPAEDLKKAFEAVGVSDSSRVVLYGENLGLLAARAYFTLDYIGMGGRTSLLDGGLEKWKSEGRSVSTESPTPGKGSLALRVDPDVVTTLGVVRDVSAVLAADGPRDGATLLIDARPAAEYAGDTAGESVQRAGHIPGAINLFWMQHIVSAENPVMRPVQELRQLYQRAGVALGARVITYCRTGVQASHSYFTAKYLGFDVSMYDGSFLEWSGTTDTHVSKGTVSPRD